MLGVGGRLTNNEPIEYARATAYVAYSRQRDRLRSN